MDRRAFVKAMAMATAGAWLGRGATGIPAGETGAAAASADPVADGALAGVSDIHIHAAPDTKPRSVGELSMARAAQAAGYRSVMFKSNDWSCHDRACLIREALPGFEVFGSLCLNRVHGDRVNAHAVEMALKTAGNLCRCVWLPTLAADYPLRGQGGGIPVLGPEGRPTCTDAIS